MKDGQRASLGVILMFLLWGLTIWLGTTVHNAFFSKETWISYKCTLYYPNGSTRNIVFVQPEDAIAPHIDDTLFGGRLYIYNSNTANLPEYIYGMIDMRINKNTSFTIDAKL